VLTSLNVWADLVKNPAVYRKAIVSAIGFLALFLKSQFGIELGGYIDVAVELLMSVATIYAVYRTANAAKPATPPAATSSAT